MEQAWSERETRHHSDPPPPTIRSKTDHRGRFRSCGPSPWRSRSSRRLDGESTRERRPPAPSSKTKLPLLFSTASRRESFVLCHIEERSPSVSSTSMLAACLLAGIVRYSRAPALPVVLLVDASLQQNAAGRNSRPTTEPRAGDRRSTAEQSAALPAADVVPRLDRAVPALADRRRSIKVGADVKKVARVAPVSGSHLAAARGVERRVVTLRGAFISVLSRGELAARLCGISGRAEQGFAGRGRVLR